MVGACVDVSDVRFRTGGIMLVASMDDVCDFLCDMSELKLSTPLKKGLVFSTRGTWPS